MKLLIITLAITLCIINTKAQVSFLPPTNFGAGINPRSIVSADFNGDGNMDIASANYGSNNVSVLLGNGLGGFGTATNFAVGTAPQSITSADFNGDGKMDLAITNGSGNVSILIGNGLGGFSTPTNFIVGTSPFSIISADFNGDGKLDLATANLNSFNISILLGNGLGGFGTATNFSVGGTWTNPQSIISADFNGDGKLDIVTANYIGDNVSVLLGNGLGSFSAPTFFTVGTGPVFLITIDFNGDGNLDLAVDNYISNNLSILLGNGLGSFSTPTILASGLYPWSITTGDFNGDGKKDLATANLNNNNNVSIYVGNGLGNFSLPLNFAAGLLPFSVISADFNGDGKMDLATANNDSNNVSVLLNISPSCADSSQIFASLCQGQVYNFFGTNYSNTGTYTHIFINGNVNGCDSTVVLNLTVNALPSVSRYASVSILCSGDTTSLFGTGALNYSWTGGVFNGVSFIPLATNIYTVTGTDANNCSSTSSISITVNLLPIPIITQAGLLLSTTTFVTYQWNLNGNPIAGGTNQNYTVTQNGSYSVAVENTNGCRNTSTGIIVNNVSVNNLLSSNTVNLYPNPTNDFIYIKGIKPHCIKVASIQGSIIQTYFETDKIDLSNMSEGLYFIQLFDNENNLFNIQKVTKL